jgi:hypothetical protein
VAADAPKHEDSGDTLIKTMKTTSTASGSTNWMSESSSGTNLSDIWSQDQSGSALQFLDRSNSMEPVKLVVFDFDETLTLATFGPKPGSAPELLTTCVGLSFHSPWVEGRLQELEKLLRSLSEGAAACKLAVLTRNSAGVRNVLQLLDGAGLSKYFTAVWCMPLWSESAYQEDGEWRFFTPWAELSEEKPDILQHIACHTHHWLPHIGSEFHLTLENILLVDDDEKNFQSSETGTQVLRGCKIAVHEGRLLPGMDSTNLGGIGARLRDDFAALQRFVSEPWLHSKVCSL